MKLYTISGWNELYENNRSRTVKSLSWVPVPNRHDGLNYARIMAHPKASILFSSWVLVIEVASRCHPRGTLVRDDGKPHDSVSLSLKTRAPKDWFDFSLEWLSTNTDWIEYKEVAGDCQDTDSVLSPDCQCGDEEQKGMEWNGMEGNVCAKNSSAFKKPTREELDLYAAKIGLPPSQVIEFIDHYESNGWRVGKVKMSSWRHTLSKWKRNFDEGRFRNNGQLQLQKLSTDELVRAATR